LPVLRAFIVLLIALTVGTVVAGAADPPRPIHQDPTIVWYRGVFSGETTSTDSFELIASVRIGESAFLYEYSPFILIPVLQLDWRREEDGSSIEYYNFRSPLCLLTQMIDAKIDGRGILAVMPAGEFRWWRALLHAHNSSLKWCLSRGWRLNLSTRTDLLPFRVHGDDQGILFTPQLALEWVGLSDGFENDALPLTNRLHVGVGYANWWSFEGHGRTPGWTVIIAVGFMAGV
jgi:hypothetical protein